MHLITLSFLCVLLSACGGSSGSSSEVLIEGTLTENGGAAHKYAALKHGSGEKIEDVTVCALGSCSTTDGEGQWGFVVAEAALGTDVLFTVNGHGIATQAVVSLPAEGEEIFISFDHVEGGVIEVSSMLVDGEELHDHADHDHEAQIEEHTH